MLTYRLDINIFTILIKVMLVGSLISLNSYYVKSVMYERTLVNNVFIIHKILNWYKTLIIRFKCYPYISCCKIKKKSCKFKIQFLAIHTNILWNGNHCLEQ